MTPTVGSLFAGVGGFDIAAERAGFQVEFQSEIEPYASKLLEHYWPSLNKGDIHALTIGQGGIPAVDVLCGGFPCQDYSIAGSRAGLAGDRGALWWEFHRLIDEGRPEWVVAENVAGLLSSRGGRDFATIIDSLVELGYGVCWAVLDAQYFGVAQRRRRVFIVGHSGGIPRPEVLAISEGVFGNPAPSRKEGQAVAALTANGIGAGGGPDDNAAQAGHLIAARMTAFGQYEVDGTASTLQARDSKGPVDLVVGFAQNSRNELRIVGDGSIAGSLSHSSGSKQTTYLLEGTSPRRLTPVEAERLQGFPDGWTSVEKMSDMQRYRQLGNAVAVPVVEWIFRSILEVC